MSNKKKPTRIEYYDNSHGGHPIHPDKLPPEERQNFGTSEICSVSNPDGWFCTRPANHSGDHIAHSGGFAYCRWSYEPVKPKDQWDSEYENKL